MLRGLNTSVKEDCSGIEVGFSYCVEVNSGTPVSSATSMTPTATPSPTYSPRLNGTVSNCDEWHFAKKGELCDTIVDEYGLTTKEFVKWNPAVGDDCSGLWAKYWYCVSIPGHELANTSTTTTTSTPTSPIAPSETQSGISKDCTRWHVATKGDACDTIVDKYSNLKKATFLTWNPAVEDDSAATSCTSSHPTPTQPGALCKCKKWHEVTKADSCWSIVKVQDNRG
ncbi:hypothetical protein G7Z17_g5790 [Cylindrodendrum hubeiense]|uniref:LysM domain-containing protein n=1 Tax=Cylindrodendrum hubeiense TaxID=595255 RepID=A0A9P5LBE3_9HYPO|nr:hypothetical protein G7Z17_g5790 [Cylindrodendrum hubeiense]